MGVLCEMCGAVVEVDFNTGDEGTEIVCPNCGKKGILYVSIIEP